MKKMKALVKARPEKGLWMQEVPIPEPGLNDVIIKVKKSAICGTDLHIYEWDAWSQKTIKTPMVIGHEYMGYIEKMGAGVTNLKIGDRVTGEGHLACGHCRNCRRKSGLSCSSSRTQSSASRLCGAIFHPIEQASSLFQPETI